MALSVSSFPEAPPKPVRHPMWQVTPSLKNSGKSLGSLLSKHSVPFLRGIGQFAKAHVKGSNIRQRVNVPPCISKHHPSLSGSSIRSPSIVIDIAPIPNNDECFSTRSSDVDASSLNPIIEISFSSTIRRAAVSTPTAAKAIPAISPIDSVKASNQSSPQSLVEVSAPLTHEKGVQTSPKEHEEGASAAYDSRPCDSQPSDSEVTTTSLISPSPTTQFPVAPSEEGRRRSHSVSAGFKASAKETIPPPRPRYKSETAIDLRRLTTVTTLNDNPSSSKGKDRDKNPVPRLPASGSTHETSTTSKKRHQKKRKTKSTGRHARGRSDPSSKSTRLSANSHRPSTAPPLQSFSLSATALVTRSPRDLLRAPHLQVRSKKSLNDGVVFPRGRSRSYSPSLLVVVSPPSDNGSQPEPSSVDRGTWLRLAAVPHAESWDRDGEQKRRRPRTAPEAMLATSW